MRLRRLRRAGEGMGLKDTTVWVVFVFIYVRMLDSEASSNFKFPSACCRLAAILSYNGALRSKYCH